MHAYTHTHTYTYAYIHTHTDIHIWIRAHTDMEVLVYVQIRVHSYAHPYTAPCASDFIFLCDRWPLLHIPEDPHRHLRATKEAKSASFHPSIFIREPNALMNR
jgi:hypothetical protein